MKPYKPTPKYHIMHALRLLWLRSKERSFAMKRDEYTCQMCKRKQTLKKGQELKVQVHHKEGSINWNALAEEVMKSLLPDPSTLITLCKECHDKTHGTTNRPKVRI